MKKSKFFLLCLLAMSLAFGFQSCKKDKDDSPATSTENTTGNGDSNTNGGQNNQNGGGNSEDNNNDKTDPVPPTFNFSESLNSENKTIENGAELTLTIGNLTAESVVSAFLDGEPIEVKDGVIILPTTSAGEHKVKVVVNNEEKEFSFKVLLPALEIKTCALSSEETELELNSVLKLNLETNNPCTITVKVNDDVIEAKDGVYVLPTDKAGEYAVSVEFNDGQNEAQTKDLSYKVLLPVLDFKSDPVLSVATPKFGDELSVKVNTNLPCTVTLKIGDEEISSENSEGEVSISIPTVVQAGDYTATIIVTDGTTTKQSEINYKIGLPDFVMVTVEGGKFQMGGTAEQGTDADSDEKPTHEVTLSSYSIGQTEVTQALWKAVMGDLPSKIASSSYLIQGDDKPIVYVTWNEIQTFLTKLNEKTGKTFRLPTEAEWEFAARGGINSKGYKYSGSNEITDVAWYINNSYDKGSAVVGSFAPNELGLYDMSGNVYEWCKDWYGAYGSYAQNNPTGPDTGSYRVIRGGGWNRNAGYCRLSKRTVCNPDNGGSHIGFRLAL